MNGKLHDTPTEWFDPDEAPELTEEWFAKATPMIGGREVTWEEYRRAAKDDVTTSRSNGNSKVAFVFKLDADILNAFVATGENWEAHMNDALREWMKANLLS